MAAPQLNFPKSGNRFITISYQSNNYLNEEVDGKAKQYIAEKLIVDAKIDVKNIHSYVHGEIIIEVPNASAVTTLKKVIAELAKPMAQHSPPLLYSVTLASYNGQNTPFDHYIYVYGDDDMNKRFLKSIEHFYPKK